MYNVYVFSTVSAEELFFIGDHDPKLRNQDEQEASFHVHSVMYNTHNSVQP